MTGPANRPRGLTLVELILAISLIALILTGAGATFRLATRASRDSMAQVQRHSQAQSALELIARDVRHLACQVDPERSSLLGAVVGGRQGGPLLRLRTTGPAVPGAEDTVVDYFVAGPVPGRPLVRRAETVVGLAPADSASAGRGTVRWEILATNVTRMALRYFDGARWVDTWDAGAAGELPRLIEVSLELGGGDSPAIRFVRCLEMIPGRPFGASSSEPMEGTSS